MYETQDDLSELQATLDRSYESSGEHLRRIITPERRLGASELARRLEGMTLLVLATATADGRPIAGPVDGIFYRGHYYFGSAPDSVRFKHIRERPWVSATHLPGEHLAVTVHGRAELIDIAAPQTQGFRQALLDIYTARYGPEWENFLNSGVQYARIDADRIYVYWMPET